MPLREAIRILERKLLLARLEQHRGVRAARESLGLKKTTFHRYMKALDIPTRAARDDADD